MKALSDIREGALTWLVDRPYVCSVILSACLFSINQLFAHDESKVMSSSIGVVLTIASIATAYLSTCKSIIVTKLDEPWLCAIYSKRPDVNFREDIMKAFFDGICWSSWMILLCVGLTVADPSVLDRRLFYVTVPWAGFGFSAFQLLYIFSIGFHLIFTFRAATVFNGFTMEMCIYLRNPPHHKYTKD